MTKLERLIKALGDISYTTAEKAVKAKSRDFFWYSPILKTKLEHITAEIVIAPESTDEVVQVLAACHALDIPVTPRGAGTGNYGQAMPLGGGAVLDMARMNRVLSIEDGVVVAEAGALMGDIDAATQNALGQELRIHPSTRETATIGGFVAGGSGGVGSIRWGMLAEPGNILAVEIVTMDAKPRILTLKGRAAQSAHHCYGVTGIITKVTMPLAPAPKWVDMLVSFPDWRAALDAGWMLAGCDGLWLKQLAAVQSPAPKDFFLRHAKFLEQGDHVLCAMVAPNSADDLAQQAVGAGGTIRYRSDRAREAERAGLPHMYHLGWNHTTLRGLRLDPAITYLQIGFPPGAEIEANMHIAKAFPEEIIGHVEFTRGAGAKRISGLPLVRFSTPDRLLEIMQQLEDIGCPVWNPHVYTLEEGGRRGADLDLLALKKSYDPKGLLNPGKLIGWDRPEYEYDLHKPYEFDGMLKKP